MLPRFSARGHLLLGARPCGKARELGSAHVPQGKFSMPKLVEGFVARIQVPAGARDILIFDDALPGFFIRKFASGKASYGVKYNIGAQQRRLSLGPVEPGVLTERRRTAADILARARLGQDVVGEKQASAGREVVTLGMLVPKYLKAREGELRPNSYVEAKRYLERDW